ncbi:hypothetical protein HDV05_002140 [Chytridiales sp. JEL 0842]|nr:hypothetical protein HDV05_002140 [Chytridiales sp. JEL 0842]
MSIKSWSTTQSTNPASPNTTTVIESPTPSPPKKKEKKPIMPPAGLSVIERVFFKSAPNKPQVIMSILLRLRLPPQIPVLKPERIVDVLRKAQAHHFRLSSYIDPDTMIAHPFADRAKDLPCLYRFVESKEGGWREVYHDEINTNFNVNDPTKPLWRTAIVLNPQDMPASSSRVFKEQTPLGVPLVTVKSTPDEELEISMGSSVLEGDQKEITTELIRREKLNCFGTELPPASTAAPSFEIMFTFHHCLGDGLSMFAFARTFCQFIDSQHFNVDDIHLENVEVVKEPPPLLDNLVDPSFLEVLPVAGSMALSNLTKKTTGGRFKGHKSKQAEKSEKRPTAIVKKDKKHVVGHATPDYDTPSSSSSTIIGDSRSPTPSVISIPPSETSTNATKPIDGALVPSIPRGPRPYTRVRYLWFPASFIASLRTKSKSENTTIAAVLVVSALAAVRTCFASLPKYDKQNGGKDLPTHQGWVVTNSVRHILPQSRLLQGGDRQSDEGLKMFGGYAGSVTNASLKLVDESDVWERCRSVRKSISTCFRASIARMKLVNYCYRHPRLWKMIEKRTDLSKMSRSYSVEVANLGAWDLPTAGPEAPETDDRLRLEHFGGVVNSSFDGVRGLFTLGVITLGGAMSVAVAYDSGSVHERDADLFVQSFGEGLKRLEGSHGKVMVGEMRK